MNADMAERSLSPAVSGSHSWTAVGVWPSGVQHVIEYRHTDGRLRALAGQAARDDGLVGAHRRFDQRATAVAGFLLPAQPSFAAITECAGPVERDDGWRRRPAPLGHMRRNNDRDVACVRGHCVVGWRTIIGAIGRDAANPGIDLRYRSAFAPACTSSRLFLPARQRSI